MKAIAATTGCPDEAVRDFLDSRYGRHFADEVANGLGAGRDLATAIDEAIERWLQQRIDARIERELGIPRRLPYLTGLVLMHQARGGGNRLRSGKDPKPAAGQDPRRRPYR
jgi:hypothetical protein